MSGFSVTEAAFSGFGLVRRRPRAAMAWTVLALVYGLASSAAFVVLAGDGLASLSRVGESEAAAADFGMGALARVLAGYAVMLVLYVGFYSVFGAALYRAMATKGDAADGFLRLGGDEVRLAMVNLILGLVMIGMLIAVGVVGALLIGGVGMAMGAGDGGAGGAMMVGLVVILFYLLMLVAALAVYVRFSFAGPMTFEAKRLVVTASWTATRGRFWPLVGCYLLAGVVGIIVSLIGAALGVAVSGIFGGGGGGMAALFAPDMTSLGAYFTPGIIAYTLVTALFSGVVMAIYAAPAMAAYRALHRRTDDVAATFD